MARIRVSGYGGDFLTLVKVFNQIVLNSHEADIVALLSDLDPEKSNGDPNLRFESIYELEPNTRYVRIRNRLINLTNEPLLIPSAAGVSLLAAFVGPVDFDVPIGQVMLFGAGNNVFAPGHGYNIKFGLEDSYQAELPFPALPGLLSDVIASTNSSGISYGLVSSGTTDNFAKNRFDPVTGENSYTKAYGVNVEDDSMLIPFIASAFTAVFFTQPPNILAPAGCACVCAEDADCEGGAACTGGQCQVACEGDDCNCENDDECAEGSICTGIGRQKCVAVSCPSTSTCACESDDDCADGAVCGASGSCLGDTFEAVSYFVIGDGDVASIMDTVHVLKGQQTATLSGIVRDAVTLAPVEKASVILYDDDHRPVNQFFTDPRGQFIGQVPPGLYSARVEHDPVLSDPIEFSVPPQGGRYIELQTPATGRIFVNARDSVGRLLPAKVTVVTTIDPEDAGKEPRRSLFDLETGQRWRYSDFIPDDPDNPETLRYIETSGYTEGGSIELVVPADREYTVFISRGVEYDLQAAKVFVGAGAAERIVTVLTRVVDPRGYVGGDFHIHSAPSLDSDVSLHDRVVSCAGEGLELAVSTDHNYVSDFQPFIDRAGLQEWMTSMIGLELTTLEGGHFNSFPTRYEPGDVTRGSFEWSQRPPQDVFDELRSRGELGPDNTIVQVNHPRDSILGYFGQYNIDALTTEVIPVGGGGFGDLLSPNGPTFRDPETGDSTFSLDFDALEVLNGKRSDILWHLRMPDDVSDLEIPEETRARLPRPGTIICDGEGEVAFPGAVDDWFNLLNQGMKLTGTANSDSHHTEGEEPGYPRTYVYVGHDDPPGVEAMAVVDAFRDHRLIMTNGPFVDVTVDGMPVGSEVRAQDGLVELMVTVMAPEWIGVNRGRVYKNGVEVHSFPIAMAGTRFDYVTNLEVTNDSWLVVVAEGDTSLFPVVPPQEIPPVQISDAVSTLAGPLGFSNSTLGDIQPLQKHVITALAVTNPIWVDADGGGFQPPGVIPRQCLPDQFGVTDVAPGDVDGMSKARFPSLPRSSLVPSMWFPRQRGELHDVRLVFEQFAGHAH